MGKPTDDGDIMDIEERVASIGKDVVLGDLPQKVHRGEHEEGEDDDNVSQFEV